MDKTISKDIRQTEQLLKNLARQANAAAHIQALAAKEIALEGKTVIPAEVVFLTEKEYDDVSIARIGDWIGIKGKSAGEELFNGKISGNVTVHKDMVLNVQLYHFDHYPVQRLSEDKKALKIVIYDPGYKTHYKNWHLAREMLGKDNAVCFMINIQPETEADEENQLEIDSFYSLNLKLESLKTSITSLFEDETLLHKIKIAMLKNHIRYIERVYGLVLSDIKVKTQQLQGKSILTHKKQWQNQQKDTELSSRDISHLKSAMNNQLKQITKTIEQAIDNFDKEDEGYIGLEKEISSFLGFVEQKSGKYLTFRMAEGAVQDKVAKANTALNGFFDTVTATVDERFSETTTEVKTHLSGWKLKTSGLELPPDDPVKNEEFLLDDSVTSGKSYEKQVPAKGIGGLLMELRTPLFMLMPFMMIFGLFGALLKGGSKGEIGRDRHYNDRPAIVIKSLPPFWEDDVNKFVDEVDKQRKKGYFDRVIDDGKEFKSFPQLATKMEEVKKNSGRRPEKEEKLDADVDTETSFVYLYLAKNASHDYVIEKLFDPGAKLLAASSSGRRTGVGIGGLIRLMSGLSEYRYLILGGLTGLICWFVITRKRSMAREIRTQKEKEQHRLNEELKQHIGKSVKQQLQRWKAKLTDQLANRQMALQQNVEQLLNHAIERRKQQKAQEYKIIQQRMAAIKSEKSLISSLKSEQRKIDSKLKELTSKIDRLR